MTLVVMQQLCSDFLPIFQFFVSWLNERSVKRLDSTYQHQQISVYLNMCTCSRLSLSLYMYTKHGCSFFFYVEDAPGVGH